MLGRIWLRHPRGAAPTLARGGGFAARPRAFGARRSGTRGGQLAATCLPVHNARPEGTSAASSALATVVPAAAAALIGASIALTVLGLNIRTRSLFSADPVLEGSLLRATVGVSLLILGAAARVPQRFSVMAAELAWRRLLSDDRTRRMTSALLAPPRDDRALQRTVFSALALAAGLLVTLLSVNLALAEWFYAWSHEHFVWSDVPLAILQVAVLAAVAIPPLILLGLCVSACHHLHCAAGHWDTRATAWLCLGTALGVGAAHELGRLGFAGAVPLAAGLPALCVSLILAATGPGIGEAKDAAPHIPGQQLPQFRDYRPRLLRAGIVCIGGSVAVVATLWLESAASTGAGPERAAAMLMVALAIGIRAGCHRSGQWRRSVGGFGMACVVAGIVAGFAAAADHAVARGSVLALACGSLVLGGIGFATAYGRETLVSRVAARSFAAAGTLSRMLLCVGLFGWIVVPVVIQLAGRDATMMMLALSLLGLGGLLVVCETGYGAAARRQRLAVAAAAAAGVVGVWRAPVAELRLASSSGAAAADSGGGKAVLGHMATGGSR